MKARDRRIFLQQGECSIEAKGLWCLIESHGDEHGKNAWPSVKRLMAQSGKGKKWVEKYLKELEEQGYLRRKKRPPYAKNKFPGNEYELFARSLILPTRVPPKTTHYQGHNTGTDTLSVESEAILRVVPRVEEDQEKYG